MGDTKDQKKTEKYEVNEIEYWTLNKMHKRILFVTFAHQSLHRRLDWDRANGKSRQTILEINKRIRNCRIIINPWTIGKTILCCSRPFAAVDWRLKTYQFNCQHSASIVNSEAQTMSSLVNDKIDVQGKAMHHKVGS